MPKAIKDWPGVGRLVAAFFCRADFEVAGRMFLDGEFQGTVIGVPDSRTELLMLRPPDVGPGLELAAFIRPLPEPGSPTPTAGKSTWP